MGLRHVVAVGLASFALTQAHNAGILPEPVDNAIDQTAGVVLGGSENEPDTGAVEPTSIPEPTDEAEPDPTQEPEPEPDANEGEPTTDFQPDPDPDASTRSTSHKSVTIASYNILSIEAAKHSNAKHYKKRADLVAHFITKRDIEIIGLQESSATQVKYLKNKLPGYATYPTKHSGAGGAGARTIFYDKKAYRISEEGYYKAMRYCKMISIPYARFTGEAGSFYLYDLHLSANAANKKPCTKNARPGGKGPDNDDGPSSRKVMTHKLVVVDGKFKKKNPKIPAFVLGDYNADNLKRDKDAGIAENELPSHMLAAAGFVDTYDLTEKWFNASYNTSHNSLRTFSTTGSHIDHIFARGAVSVRWWENGIGKETLGASDHTPVIIEAELS